MHACMCVGMNVSTYVCVYVCMHACIYVCMNVSMYVCVYECMHARMCVCIMFVCIMYVLRARARACVHVRSSCDVDIFTVTHNT